MLERAVAQRSQNLPFVLFSKPGDTEVRGIFQKGNALYRSTNFTEEGFVMAPFHKDRPAIYIPNDEKLIAQYDFKAISSSVTQQKIDEAKDFKKKAYLDLVHKGLAKIKEGEFQKVVLSRILEIPFKKDILDTFLVLLNNYPHAFCYLWFHPRKGTWIGATPEVLVKVRGKAFTTFSLAGTQELNGDAPPIWNKKERHEQELVTDYIINVLSPKMVSLNKSKLESIRAGSLWHLRTKISGTMLDGGLEPLLKVLHPTPAVCGLPFLTARDFILREENYDREFYTGFLGEIRSKESADLYVNLRCAQIKRDLAYIYVGGGITRGSHPEKEWLETVAKSKTLMKFFR